MVLAGEMRGTERRISWYLLAEGDCWQQYVAFLVTARDIQDIWRVNTNNQFGPVWAALS